MALVTYYGIRMAYRVNQEADGKAFIERFAVLSVPVSVKFFVGLIPGIFVIFTIIAIASRVWVDLTPYVGPIFTLVFPFIIFWFYWLVSRSVRRFGENLNS